MLVYLDTEFTSFEKPELISIGLTTREGHELYLELEDYPRDLCSEFVRRHVVPLLGRLPGASCTRSTISNKLKSWLSALPSEHLILFDFVGDWVLLCRALGIASDIPSANGMDTKILESEIINDPVFVFAQNEAYTSECPRHHALYDARGIKAGHEAWLAGSKSKLEPSLEEMLEQFDPKKHSGETMADWPNTHPKIAR
jgi:hypothetical protein